LSTTVNAEVYELLICDICQPVVLPFQRVGQLE
jgi:hypothetical protein